MYVGVIVDLNNIKLNKEFYYNVSRDIESEIELGLRVYVSFNRRDTLAFVTSIHEGRNDKFLEITKIKDPINYLSGDLFDLAISLANSTCQNYISIFNLMLPAALRAKYDTYLTLVDKERLDSKLSYMFTTNEKYYFNYLEDNTSLIKKEIKNGHLKLNYEIKDKANSLKKKYIKLISETYSSPKQLEAIKLIKSGIDLVSELNALGYNSSVNTLVKNGNAYFYYKEDLSSDTYEKDDKKIILNNEQTLVLEELKKTLNTNTVSLLHGVTGSGKTEVYLNLIEEVVKEGGQALFMVPEISLTYQMIRRFYSRFDRISVLHSKLSDQKRFIEYKRILNGEVDVVIGVRSAVFSPLKNLKLIILDEAHSDNYVQETSPNYDAKKVAMYRGQRLNIPVVLGSATPSITDYTYAKLNRYKYLSLANKALNNYELPIEIVDLKEEEDKIISTRLDWLIKNRLTKHEQIIILNNRLGYSPFLICPSCGKVKKCPHCDISLTYYKKDNKLKCHYCGREYHLTTCECGERFESPGVGTEKLEELLSEKYQARVLRLDKESARTNNEMNNILKSFEKGEADILLGTSMISKGLDFPNCTLVAVINADKELNLPSYNSAEKAYQLLSQVAGRSGRGTKKGEVIIQTYNPTHYALTNLNNYEAFYQEEIRLRKLAKYPPFSNIILLEFRSKDEKSLEKYSVLASRHLTKNLQKSKVIGPSDPMVRRVNDVFIKQVIIIKYKDEVDLYPYVMQILDNTIKNVSVKVIFDPEFI